MNAFRLVTVERLRGQQFDARGRELRAAIAGLQEILSRRERLTADLNAGLNRALSGDLNGRITSTGADLHQAGTYREHLRSQIEAMAIRIEDLQQQLASARAAWLAARGELRAVQALHERHRTAIKAERARRDQREADELAGRRRGPAMTDAMIEEVTW